MKLAQGKSLTFRISDPAVISTFFFFYIQLRLGERKDPRYILLVSVEYAVRIA